MSELNFGDLAMLRWLKESPRPSGEVSDFGDEAAYTKKMRPRKLKKLGLIESVQHHTGQRFGGATVSLTAAGKQVIEEEHVHVWVGYSHIEDRLVFVHEDEQAAVQAALDHCNEEGCAEWLTGADHKRLIDSETLSALFTLTKLPVIEKA